MGKQTAKAMQIGDSATPNFNYVLRIPDVPDGTLEIRKGTVDAPGTLVGKFNADGTLTAAIASAPVFNAVNGLALSVPNAVNTVLVLDTEIADPGNFYDTANGRFTPNVAGYYSISGMFGLQGSVAGGTQIVTLLKNGAAILTGNRVLCSNLTPIAVSGDWIIYLNGTTDYVQLAAFQSVGSTQSGLVGGSSFSGFLVKAGA